MSANVRYGYQVVLPPQYSIDHQEKTNEFIMERGLDAVWDKAIFCPCQNEYRMPDQNCPICSGRGITHIDPTEIPVLFTRMEGLPDFMEPGLWLFGTAYISTTGDVKLGVRDRITLKEFSTSYIEMAHADALNRILPRFPLLELEYLYYRDENLLVSLIKNIDFTITGEVITLSDDFDSGIIFSLRYKSYLRYLVTAALHEARGLKNYRQDTIRHPNQYLVRREDMVEVDKGRELNAE